MNHKKTILILILVIVAFFTYWFFFISKTDSNQNTQNANQNVKAQGATSNPQYDKEFVSSLLGLSSVSLDVSILQSKVYKALNYPETPFVVNYSMESGRKNPFLPIGVDVSDNATANVKNQENTTEVAPPVNESPVIPPPATTSTTTVKPIPKKF